MNKREKDKEKTREIILTRGKALFLRKGSLSTSTKEVAREAGVAHGTLFFHFKTKEILILEIIDRELGIIVEELHRVLHQAANLENLITLYLDFLEKEEDFFSLIAREFPFFSDPLKRQIVFRQGSVRGYFFVALEKGIQGGVFKAVDRTGAMTFFFGTIEYLLARRESLCGEKSIIKEKKDQLIHDFLLLLKKI